MKQFLEEIQTTFDSGFEEASSKEPSKEKPNEPVIPAKED